jgi:HEAT repeat protein
VKRKTYEDEVRELDAVADSPRSAEAHARLAAALASKRSLVAARAAKLIKQHRLEGFDAELKAVLMRCLVDPIKTDPICHAKQAALEALDFCESSDAEPFLRAARHVQWEGASDTAAPLRARAIFGLARLGAADFDLVAATLLADGQPPVRQAALEALVHRGDRNLAPLALSKLLAGDDDPLVTLAAMTALVTLAPEWGRAHLAALLDGDDDGARELAAVALGQSRDDAALDILLAALANAPLADAREPILRGIGLHRSDRALTALLEVVREGAEADAIAALSSLAARRFEPGVAEKVRAAASENPRADLAAAVAEHFER